MRDSTARNISPNGPNSLVVGTIKVLVAAGGTGGHVYPAIAIADALCKKQPETEIRFVGTKNHMEWEAVPRAGYDITNIWISGFHRRFTLKNLLFPVKLATSLFQSLNIIRKFKPDVVVSCGGYVAGPVSWVGQKKGIPLVIQEQNSFPGVTNRILGKKAELIFIAFKNAASFFPPGKTKLAGNPTRQSLVQADRKQALNKFGFDDTASTLLILGGSGGARRINEAMAMSIKKLHDEMNLRIIWQCGRRYYDQLCRDIQPQDFRNLILSDFIHDMPAAYAVADLVISRAGALSCSELALTAKPSILVPSPNVAGDHQTKNAQSMVDEGAAALIPDNEIEEKLAEKVGQIITDQQLLDKMSKAAKKLARPAASETIADEIVKLANKKT